MTLYVDEAEISLENHLHRCQVPQMTYPRNYRISLQTLSILFNLLIV